MKGIPASLAEVAESDLYVNATRVSDRGSFCDLRVDDRAEFPPTIEQFASENLASGEGTPEWRAWCRRQEAKRGLG